MAGLKVEEKSISLLLYQLATNTSHTGPLTTVLSIGLSNWRTTIVHQYSGQKGIQGEKQLTLPIT